MKNIFIIGSKGIPANYGGFETFVEELVSRKSNGKIRYHISCLSDNNGEFKYNEERCFNVKVPEIGSARAVYYDILALANCISYIENNNICGAKIYVLACRIGPFVSHFKRKLKKNNVKLYLNPDGHEWKRSKWNFFIKKYWKLSERLMVKHSDLVICDSKAIEEYIQQEYSDFHPVTKYISYGADIIGDLSNESEFQKVKDWRSKFSVESNEYYLIVGRFVPENNYELMIREFMKTKVKKDLVIISNVEQNKLYEHLCNETNFKEDPRIKFVGTVYDQSLLSIIRKEAYGYIHGHEVGGTNPSLLEALGTTDANLLLDVNFNKEVGMDGGYYFSKEQDDLANLIEELDGFSEKELTEKGLIAKQVIKDNYSWNSIVSDYEDTFFDY